MTTATRLSLFDHPFFLGFDRFEREIERLGKSAGGYPPYNVEQLAGDRLRITLAVAGFTAADLDIELENNHLTVYGRQLDEAAGGEERLFLHRGIASRQFKRSFVLADGIKVADAWLENGLLHIDMIRILPDRTARKIEISRRDDSGKQAMTIENARVENDPERKEV
jgi:HSP20 family molecular chaperone IbpA